MRSSLSFFLILFLMFIIPSAYAQDVYYDETSKRFGYYNIQEGVVTPPRYDRAIDFTEGLAAVKDGKWGFIDETGKEVIPCTYDYAYYFREGFAAVKLNNKYGFIDKTGKEVIPRRYDNNISFYEGLAAVKIENKWGFVDKTGKEIIPCRYDETASFSEGRAAVKTNGKWGFIDRSGTEIISCKYDNTGNFSEGLAAVQLNGKCGFIDKTGREIIPCKYDRIEGFSEGLAAVQSDGKSGFIDKTGKEVIPRTYDTASSFTKTGYASVYKGKWGFIDRTGKEIVPCKYDDVWGFSEGIAVMKLNGKRGLVDQTGKEIIPGKYDVIRNFKKGFAPAKLNDKYGILDKTGKEVIPVIYDTEYDAFKQLAGSWNIYAKGYVEEQINRWQQKGRYEKNEDFMKRVTEENRKREAQRFAREARDKFIETRSKSIPLSGMYIKDYNSEAEAFIVHSEAGLLSVKVPVSAAEGFEKSFATIRPVHPKYDIIDDRIALVALSFPYNGQTYKYDIHYTAPENTEIIYAFDPIDMHSIGTTATTMPAKTEPVAKKQAIIMGKSDVDLEIPKSKSENPNRYAVVIGNESYSKYHTGVRKITDVPFAMNDAKVFAEYCEKAFGIPNRNIYRIENADLVQMKRTLNMVCEKMEILGSQGEIIFYYAGHGVVGENNKMPYLLPINVYSTETENALPLKEVYAQLGNSGAGRVTVFLDACYTGAEGTRAGARVYKEELVPGNLVVFAAADTNQVANPYTQENHGLFTYYLLKGLKEKKNYEELYRYVQREVGLRSIDLLSRQTPKVIPGRRVEEEWKAWKITD